MGLVLLRGKNDIRKALVFGQGKAIVVAQKVAAYAEGHVEGNHSTLKSVVVEDGADGNGAGRKIVADRLNYCWTIAPDKPVFIVCAQSLENWYAQFGFQRQIKEICPPEIRGGRTDMEWCDSDRIWMACTYASYQAKARQVKSRPNALVKVSGDLIGKHEFHTWLRALTRDYYATVCIGGGTKINEAFLERGWPIRFGPLGRITENFEQRQIARDVLEQNQSKLQDKLDRYGINARILIPVADIGGVLCHVNGDVYVLAAYNGYDKIFILTTQDRVDKKENWLREVSRVLSNGEEELDKISVVGF